MIAFDSMFDMVKYPQYSIGYISHMFSRGDTLLTIYIKV